MKKLVIMYVAKNKSTGVRSEFTWLSNDNLIIDDVVVDVNDWVILQVLDGGVITDDRFENEPNPPYIVCWVEKHIDPMDYNDVQHVDKYAVFLDEPNNKYAAKVFYDVLEKFTEDEERGVSLYSANLCQVIESTDYAC